jgi:hypothetical protein
MHGTETSNPKESQRDDRVEDPLSAETNHAMTSATSTALRAIDCDPSTPRTPIWFHARGPSTFHRVPASVVHGFASARPSFIIHPSRLLRRAAGRVRRRLGGGGPHPSRPEPVERASFNPCPL